MEELADLIARRPIVPFIRESDYAVRQPWKYGARRLLDYLLIYVQEGLCRIGAEGTEHRFGAGEFCLLQPGDLIALEGTTRTVTPFAHFDIFYNAQREDSFPTRPGQIDLTEYAHLMQPRLNDCRGIHVPVRFMPAEPQQFRDTFLHMIGLWQRRDPMPQLEAQQLAMELVLALLRDHGGAQRQTSAAGPLLQWVTSYFSLHLAEPLRIEDMAERAQLSPSRFAAVFRKQFGMPPHRYLLHMRIRHARSLLRAGTFSMKRIAEYCGFADVHHFSKTFKAVTGVPPGDYRDGKTSSDAE